MKEQNREEKLNAQNDGTSKMQDKGQRWEMRKRVMRLGGHSEKIQHTSIT